MLIKRILIAAMVSSFVTVGAAHAQYLQQYTTQPNYGGGFTTTGPNQGIARRGKSPSVVVADHVTDAPGDDLCVVHPHPNRRPAVSRHLYGVAIALRLEPL